MMILSGKRAFLFLIGCLSLVACGNSPATTDDAVKIDKQSAQVKTEPFVPKAEADKLKQLGKPPAGADIEAYTDWFFSCKADLRTEDVFHDDTPQACSMALKVTGVNFKLALPITIYLPRDAKASLVKHEEGHAQICSIIYGRADDACLEAARQVIGKTFNGMGKTPQEARNMALSQAQHIIAQCYHEGTSNLVESASQKYESFCIQYAHDPKKTAQDLARSAAASVLDIPVTVIK